MKKTTPTPDHRPGMYWLCHHRVLVEWVTDYEKRAQCIRTEKKVRERPCRLKWFRRVQGDLPAELVEAARVARETIDKWEVARNASIDCLCSSSQGNGPYDVVRYKKLNDIEKAIEKEGLAAETKYFALLTKHHAEVVRLFEKECPGCPWDGERLVFPRYGM